MGLYKKRGIWYYSKQYQGRKAQGCLGTKKKQLALQVYDRTIVPRILDGSYWKKPPEEPTMKEVLQKYMNDVSPMQKGHKRNREIAAYFYDYFGSCLVSGVTVSHLAEYKAKRLTGQLVHGRGQGRRAGESTVKKELSFLRMVFNKAISEWKEHWDGWFREHADNPVKPVIKGLRDHKRIRYLLVDEAERLSRALCQSKQEYLREMVIVGCQTGLREANIVELKVAQCDFVQGRINKTGGEMKNDEPFSIKMTSTVEETLKKVIKSRKIINPYVFVNEKGQPWTPNAVSVAFGRACKRANIDDLRFHDLRHDFASLLINNGASLFQVQHALNHKDPRMAARYAHLFPENRDAVSKIDNEGTAAILLRAGEPNGNSTTRLLPEGENEKGLQAATP